MLQGDDGALRKWLLDITQIDQLCVYKMLDEARKHAPPSLLAVFDALTQDPGPTMSISRHVPKSEKYPPTSRAAANAVLSQPVPFTNVTAIPAVRGHLRLAVGAVKGSGACLE